MVCSSIKPTQFPVLRLLKSHILPHIHQDLGRAPFPTSACTLRICISWHCTSSSSDQLGWIYLMQAQLSTWMTGKKCPWEVSGVRSLLLWLTLLRQEFLSWGDLLQAGTVCFCSRNTLLILWCFFSPTLHSPAVVTLTWVCLERKAHLCLYCLPESCASAPSAIFAGAININKSSEYEGRLLLC